MSHFYRVRTKTQSRRFELIGSKFRFGFNHPLPMFREYEDLFEVVEQVDKLGITVFRAPLIVEKRIAFDLILRVKKKGDQYPDFVMDSCVTAVVSAACKAVIEKVDTMEHQFYPMNLLDKKGNNLADQQYYHMAVRRIIEIPVVENLDVKPEMFYPGASEKPIIAGYQASAGVRGYLAEQPIWCFKGLKDVMFINQGLLDSLRGAGLTGLVSTPLVVGDIGKHWCAVVNCKRSGDLRSNRKSYLAQL